MNLLNINIVIGSVITLITASQRLLVGEHSFSLVKVALAVAKAREGNDALLTKSV